MIPVHFMADSVSLKYHRGVNLSFLREKNSVKSDEHDLGGGEFSLTANFTNYKRNLQIK